MRKIENRNDIKELLNQEMVVVFFYSSWSEYSQNSKSIVESIANYDKMKGSIINFWFGQLEEDLVYLAKEFAGLGVPKSNFCGNGSLSFFANGKHIACIDSVVSEGIDNVNCKIEKIFNL